MREVIITTRRLIKEKDWAIYVEFLSQHAPKGFNKIEFLTGFTESREKRDPREIVHTTYEQKHTLKTKL